MDEHISTEIEGRIRQLCRQISIAHNLDEEIQRELYSHMEDKLIGYLSGEEKVSEEDAFILVREHFGDPAVIKGLLQETHAVESGLSLLRKLGAVAAASLATMSIVRLLWLALRYHIPKEPAFIMQVAIVRYFLAWGHLFGPVLLLGIVIGVWRKMMDNGRPLWFATFIPERFAAVLFGLVFLMIFLYLPRERAASEWEHAALLANIGAYTTMFSNILLCMLWVWWVDTKPRRYRTMLTGALAWIGFFMATVLIREVSSGDYAVLGNPFLYLLVTIELLVTVAVAVGLYLVIRNLGAMRDRMVEVVTR